jgi:hypothetical protein
MTPDIPMIATKPMACTRWSVRVAVLRKNDKSGEREAIVLVIIATRFLTVRATHVTKKFPHVLISHSILKGKVVGLWEQNKIRGNRAARMQW